MAIQDPEKQKLRAGLTSPVNIGKTVMTPVQMNPTTPITPVKMGDPVSIGKATMGAPVQMGPDVSIAKMTMAPPVSMTPVTVGKATMGAPVQTGWDMAKANLSKNISPMIDALTPDRAGLRDSKRETQRNFQENVLALLGNEMALGADNSLNFPASSNTEMDRTRQTINPTNSPAGIASTIMGGATQAATSAAAIRQNPTLTMPPSLAHTQPATSPVMLRGVGAVPLGPLSNIPNSPANATGTAFTPQPTAGNVEDAVMRSRQGLSSLTAGKTTFSSTDNGGINTLTRDLSKSGAYAGNGGVTLNVMDSKGEGTLYARNQERLARGEKALTEFGREIDPSADLAKQAAIANVNADTKEKTARAGLADYQSTPEYQNGVNASKATKEKLYTPSMDDITSNITGENGEVDPAEQQEATKFLSMGEYKNQPEAFTDYRNFKKFKALDINGKYNTLQGITGSQNIARYMNMLSDEERAQVTALHSKGNS